VFAIPEFFIDLAVELGYNRPLNGWFVLFFLVCAHLHSGLRAVLGHPVSLSPLLSDIRRLSTASTQPATKN
jgi:hypothetical protein